jgi:predicted nucleotidyltransferase
MSLLRLKRLSAQDPSWKILFKEIIDRVVKVEPSATIFIFGSFVANRLTAESDIDIAVIIPDSESPKAVLKRIYEGGRLAEWPVDLLVFRNGDFIRKSQIGGVCFDIRESGIELFPNWRLDGTLS